jgi:hypothetical protein
MKSDSKASTKRQDRVRLVAAFEERRRRNMQGVQKWQVCTDTDRKPMGKCESVNR